MATQQGGHFINLVLIVGCKTELLVHSKSTRVTSKIRFEFAGIVATTRLPYASPAGMYKVAFAPLLSSKKPICQPKMSFFSGNVTGLEEASNTVAFASNLPS